MMAEAAHRRAMSARASITCWSTNTRTPTGCRRRILLALKPTGRGLTVVGDDAQSIYSFRAATVRNILDFPAQFRRRRDGRHARAQLPLDAADPRRRQCRDRARRRALQQEPVVGPRLRPSGRSWSTSPTKPAQAGYVVDEGAGAPRGRHRAEGAGRAVPRLAPQRRARDRADAPQHSLRQIRRAQVPRSRARQGCAGLPALGGEPARPRRRLPRAAAAAGHRPGDGRARCSTHRRGAIRRRAGANSSRRPPPPKPGRTSPSRSSALRRNAAGWPAELEPSCRWYEPHLERLLRGRERARRPTSRSWRRSPSSYPSRERFLTELTLDPPDATSDEAGAPLLDEDYLILSTIHSAKGQEWKAVFVLNAVDGCIPSDLSTGTRAEIEEERRLLYVAMTRAKDQLHLMVPQRFFVTQQRGQRRPPRLCAAHALHPAGDPEVVRGARLAAGRRRQSGRGDARRRRRRARQAAPDVGLRRRP